MDFARNLLIKSGWSEGQGLGKTGTGILNPLKANLKFDTAGIGHDPAKQFVDQWWVKAYNAVSDNIKIKTDAEEVSITTIEQDVEYTSRHYTFKQMKLKNPELEYGAFVKTATLMNDGMKKVKNKVKTKTKLETTIKSLTDEELFAACGGRTAHKGARHGLKLSGKLARIEAQEQKLLKLDEYKSKKSQAEEDQKQIKTLEDSVVENIDSLSEPQQEAPKKKKHKKSQKEEKIEEEIMNCDSEKKKQKKKNRHRENESFTTEVTEINKVVDGHLEENSLLNVEVKNNETVISESKKKKKSRKRKTEDIADLSQKDCLEIIKESEEFPSESKKKKKSRKSKNEDFEIENTEIKNIDENLVEITQEEKETYKPKKKKSRKNKSVDI